MNFFNGMFGKVANGMCRLGMNGGIAVKTSSGYKTYNLKTNRLTNCNNFVFDIGDEMFFVIPTNHVMPGDIILVGSKPKCVVSAGKGTITVLNYEDSTVETMLPERHVFMGNTYFYGKIVSMFGNMGKDGKGTKNIMKYMMLSNMMKNGESATGSASSMMSMAPLLLMGGSGFGDVFDGMFDFDSNDDDDDDDAAKATTAEKDKEEE